MNTATMRSENANPNTVGQPAPEDWFVRRWAPVWVYYQEMISSCRPDNAVTNLAYVTSVDEVIRIAWSLIENAAYGTSIAWAWRQDLQRSNEEVLLLGPNDRAGCETAPPFWHEMAVNEYERRADSWADLGWHMLEIVEGLDA